MGLAFSLGWYEWIILAFAAFRFTQFFVFDSLAGFNPESGSKASIALDAFAYDETGKDRSFIRGKIGDLLTCPWCLGFWLSAFVYLAFIIASGRWDAYPLVIHLLGVFAVAGGQGFLNAHTD